MRALGKELRDDPDLRALVVIGNGRAFSSGIDTSVFTGGGGRRDRGRRRRGTRHADPTVDGILRTQEAYSWLEEARYPTIAAVRGYALGAGLQLALACDIRVFARGTSGRAARAQVRHPARPRRHAAAAARRRRGQGQGADLDRGAHRRRRGVPHRAVRAARRRRRARSRRRPRSRPRSRPSRRSRCRARSARSRPPVALPVAEGLVVEAEAPGGLPAVGRHARGDHGVRRTTRSRLHAVSSLSAMTRFRVRASGPLEGVVQPSRARPRTRA